MSKNGGMSRDKNKKRHITNFYMETLVLVVIFIVVILVLTRVFALSGKLSARAEILTGAVHLAENAAEAVSASGSPEELWGLLEEGNAEQIQKEDSCVLSFGYNDNMEPTPGGNFRVEVTWQSAEGGGFAESRVAVYWMGEPEPVYTLDTAVCFPTGID